MIYSVKQTKLDRMVEDIKHLGMDKNPVGYYSTDFTKGHILTAHDLNSGEDVAIGTIKVFWLPELFSSAPELALEVKQYRLKDCAITQAEHMKAQVGDNTWHYAMEVWLYPLTQYWEVEDELALIERYISTNRDAWVKHWGEPSEVVRKRGD